MFGREKVECPGCKKVFRKKDMKTRCNDAKGRMSEYYLKYSCVDCCTKPFWSNMYDDAEAELIVAWEHKASSSENLLRLYQERPMLTRNNELIGNQHAKAKQNVRDAGSKSENTIGEQPTGLLGVAFDLLDESYKSRPAYQIAAAEEARLDVEKSKTGEAYYENRINIVKEIEKIEGKIFCYSCLKLQPFQTPTMEGFERVDQTGWSQKYQNFEVFKTIFVLCRVCGKEHRKPAEVKRDEIKEPARQNNDNNFCDNCGKSLRPTAKFCGSCGTRIA